MAAAFAAAAAVSAPSVEAAAEGWSEAAEARGAPIILTQRMPTEREIRRFLRDRGFRRIRIESIGYSRANVVACSDGRRERLEVDANLRTRFLEDLGNCRSGAEQPDEALSPQVEADLVAMGFDQVVIEPGGARETEATACRNGFAYKMRYDRRDILLDAYRTGECVTAPPPIDPLPPTVPDYGDNLGPREVRDALFSQGYRRVFVDRDLGSTYAISGCYAVRRFEMIVDRSARVLARQARGFCRIDGGQGSEYVPPRPVSQDVLRSREPLDPSTCQAVLNWFQANRPITFESGSARLDPEGERIIREMAQGVDRCGDVQILVEGHTDAFGNAAANKTLSEERAANVEDILVRFGVPRFSVSSAGYGEQHPIASNETPDGRALNRRIELNLEWGDVR